MQTVLKFLVRRRPLVAVVVITTAQEDVKRRRINPDRTEDRLRENSQEKLKKMI